MWKNFFKNVIFQHFLKCFNTFWTWWKMNFLKNFFPILINIYILEFWETFVVQNNAFFCEKSIFSIFAYTDFCVGYSETCVGCTSLYVGYTGSWIALTVALWTSDFYHLFYNPPIWDFSELSNVVFAFKQEHGPNKNFRSYVLKNILNICLHPKIGCMSEF